MTVISKLPLSWLGASVAAAACDTAAAVGVRVDKVFLIRTVLAEPAPNEQAREIKASKTIIIMIGDGL